MQTSTKTIIAAALIAGCCGASFADDAQQRLQLQHELTSTIPATGAHALESLKQDLRESVVAQMLRPEQVLRICRDALLAQGGAAISGDRI